MIVFETKNCIRYKFILLKLGFLNLNHIFSLKRLKKNALPQSVTSTFFPKKRISKKFLKSLYSSLNYLPPHASPFFLTFSSPIFLLPTLFPCPYILFFLLFSPLTKQTKFYHVHIVNNFNNSSQSFEINLNISSTTTKEEK